MKCKERNESQAANHIINTVIAHSDKCANSSGNLTFVLYPGILNNVPLLLHRFEYNFAVQLKYWFSWLGNFF